MSERSKKHRSTPEAKAKQAELTRKMWQDNQMRQKLTESLNTDENRKKLSDSSKALWNDSEFRDKMNSVQTSEEYIKHHRKKSLELLDDEDYIKKRNSGLKERRANMTKEERLAEAERSAALWTDEEYRKKQHIIRNTPEFKRAASERSKAMWTPEFRTKVSEYRNNEEFRQRMSEISKSLWESEEYRSKIMAGKQETQYRNDRSQQMIQQWQNTDYRSKMEIIYASPEYKSMMSQLGEQRWSDPEYRNRMETAIRKMWNDDGYRSKMIQIFQSKEQRDKIAITSAKLWQDPAHRERMAQVRANQPRISSLQTLLYRYLDDLKVPYHQEGPDTIIGYYVFDCLIPGNGTRKHLLIECQGEYWHTIPGVDARDRSKFTYVDRYFPEYEILYLWEHEFSVQERVLSRLRAKLGLQSETIDFDLRDVLVREISAIDAKGFLDAYHYIGKGRGGKSFGAFLGDELMACSVFSPPLRQNTAAQFGLVDGELRELSRLCIHSAYQKKNFGTWFISRSVKLAGNPAVVAYADTTAGHTGTVYRASGFQLHHEVPPDYWYVDLDGFIMHKRTLYGRAVRMGMTEREYAERHNYQKKWGGKKLCYTRIPPNTTDRI